MKKIEYYARKKISLTPNMKWCFARKKDRTFSCSTCTNMYVFFLLFPVPVKLRDVHLKPNNMASTSESSDELSPGTNEEIVFYCFPMLDGIVDPHTVVVDVEWWVEDQLVIEESFNLKARSSGILQPQFWKMGQTVRMR